MTVFDHSKDFLARHPVAVMMTLSLIIKLILFNFEQVINPDGVLYIAAGRQIAAGDLGEAIKLYPMPAYPMLLALFHLILSDWVAAARVIGVAAMVLATIPLYGITRMLLNRQAAFWATLCFTVTPEANEQALMVIRDPIFLLAALSMIWFALRGLRKQSLGHMVLALLLTAAAFIFRVEGVVLYGASVVFLALSSMVGKNSALKLFARKCLAVWFGVPIVLAIIAGLLAGPNLLSHNRVGELMSEVRQIVQLKAFDNYQEIYQYFKTIETEPPFSGFSKSLPAIVRHWMPVIYLIGLLEYFIKQIFPLFLLPLLVTAGQYLSRENWQIDIEKRFVLVIWTFYMLFILYSFIIRDFIQGRFLFTPAILLYPWVGHGIALLIKWLRGIRFAWLTQVAMTAIIVVVPCVKIVQGVVTSDKGALTVGRFLSQYENFGKNKVLYSDSRFWLYGNGSDPYHSIISPTWSLSRYLEMGNAGAIEKMAVKYDAEALVLAINFDKTDAIPQFEHYRIFKQFPSRKGVVIIYRKSHQE